MTAFDRACQWVSEGTRVVLRTMQGDHYAEGVAIAACDVPTVTVRADDGRKITWRVDLAAAPAPDTAPAEAVRADVITPHGRMTVIGPRNLGQMQAAASRGDATPSDLQATPNLGATVDCRSGEGADLRADEDVRALLREPVTPAPVAGDRDAEIEFQRNARIAVESRLKEAFATGGRLIAEVDESRAEVERLRDSERRWQWEAERLKREIDLTASSSPEETQPDVAAYRDTLSAIWLYVNDDHVMRQLTTEQKDLWADAIDAARDPGDTTWRPYVRWWRDTTPPLCTTLPAGMECPGRGDVECIGCTMPAPAEPEPEPDRCTLPSQHPLDGRPYHVHQCGRPLPCARHTDAGRPGAETEVIDQPPASPLCEQVHGGVRCTYPRMSGTNCCWGHYGPEPCASACCDRSSAPGPAVTRDELADLVETAQRGVRFQMGGSAWPLAVNGNDIRIAAAVADGLAECVAVHHLPERSSTDAEPTR